TIPTGWTLHENEGYVALNDPDGGIQISLLVLPGAAEAMEEAVKAAWTIAAPSAPPEPIQTLELPPSQGIERSIAVNYQGADQRIYEAFAEYTGNHIYLLLIDADLATLQRR